MRWDLARGGLLYWRPYHHRYAGRNRDDRGPGGRSRRGSLGDHRTYRRFAGDGALRRRCSDNRRGLSDRRNNLARLRTLSGRSSLRRRRRSGGDGGCRLDRRRHGSDGRLPHGHRRLGLVFLLPGQDGFHYVPGLGDVGEIDLWCDSLSAAGA
jgi:hypothetical protein